MMLEHLCSFSRQLCLPSTLFCLLFGCFTFLFSQRLMHSSVRGWVNEASEALLRAGYFPRPYARRMRSLPGGAHILAGGWRGWGAGDQTGSWQADDIFEVESAVEKREDDSRVVGRAGRADALPNFTPEQTHTSPGLGDGRFFWLTSCKESASGPFIASPGSKEDEEDFIKAVLLRSQPP